MTMNSKKIKEFLGVGYVVANSNNERAMDLPSVRWCQITDPRGVRIIIEEKADQKKMMKEPGWKKSALAVGTMLRYDVEAMKANPYSIKWRQPFRQLTENDVEIVSSIEEAVAAKCTLTGKISRVNHHANTFTVTVKAYGLPYPVSLESRIPAGMALSFGIGGHIDFNTTPATSYNNYNMMMGQIAGLGHPVNIVNVVSLSWKDALMKENFLETATAEIQGRSYDLVLGIQPKQPAHCLVDRHSLNRTGKSADTIEIEHIVDIIKMNLRRVHDSQVDVSGL